MTPGSQVKGLVFAHNKREYDQWLKDNHHAHWQYIYATHEGCASGHDWRRVELFVLPRFWARRDPLSYRLLEDIKYATAMLKVWGRTLSKA